MLVARRRYRIFYVRSGDTANRYDIQRRDGWWPSGWFYESQHDSIDSAIAQMAKLRYTEEERLKTLKRETKTVRKVNRHFNSMYGLIRNIAAGAIDIGRIAGGDGRDEKVVEAMTQWINNTTDDRVVRIAALSIAADALTPSLATRMFKKPFDPEFWSKELADNLGQAIFNMRPW